MEQIFLTSITLNELLDKITERINIALSIKTSERKETQAPEDLLTIEDLREIVMAIGIILIALRLFFPVQEIQIFKGENRVNPSVIAKEELKKFGKTVVISKTIFQSLGIAVLTGGFILISNLRKKQNP